jgi:lysophospholipase L1-like esterase
LRTYEKGTEYFASISYIFRNEELFEMSNSNSNKIKEINNLINNWENKNVVVYGDSITAQGNGDNAECVNSYFYPAYKKFGFKNLYVRGIGGQTYMWNTGGYYSAVGSNGKYLNRYNFDSEGNQLSTTVSPIRTTAEEKANIESFYGKSIEIHYGAFCSWDRITSMIPSDIRESIDLIIVCGGTNDHSHIEEIIVDGEIAANEPIWKPNDKTDPTWGTSSMYLGGDYDINTLSGAIASTVMKMQTWCPNAVVVVATPFPAFDTTTKQQLINSAGLSFRNLCKIEIDVAGMIGIDVIDANGKCGINGANFYLYQTDGTHPNAEGRKMYSRVFNGELNRIAAKEK